MAPNQIRNQLLGTTATPQDIAQVLQSLSNVIGSTTMSEPPAPANIDVALASVPIAQDGAVIDAEYHNSLRAALRSLADYVGASTIDQSSVMSLAPAFLPLLGALGNLPWAVGPAFASGLNSSDGWLPLALPDGVRLDSLAVSHRSEPTLSTFTVRLARYPILGSAAEEDVFRISRQSGNKTDRTDVVSQVAGSHDPAGQEELRRVDNSQYRYVIFGRSLGSSSSGVQENQVHVRSIQVTYTG
jgi:hypothetical protein